MRSNIVRCSFLFVVLIVLLSPLTAPPGQSSVSGNTATHRLFLPLVGRQIYGIPRATRINYGATIVDLNQLPRLRDIGFSWAQVLLSWSDVEPVEAGGFRWKQVDAFVKAARQYHVQLVVRVEHPPAWARVAGTTATGPPRPEKLSAWEQFLRALAERGRGAINAYIIWNEPNLAEEWGGLPPNPSYYTNVLERAYTAIKAEDPAAVVVSGPLASTGRRGRDPVAWDDLIYLEELYRAGASSHFDALGSNPHGFGRPPETDPGSVDNGFAFRWVERQRQVMERFGDDATDVWALEVGWLVEPGATCYDHPDWSDRLWQRVSEAQQADYLARAYRYALDHWPWMKAMIMFNLDFGASYGIASCPVGTDSCHPMRYYSLIYRNDPCNPPESSIRFRPAYWALRDMPKP